MTNYRKTNFASWTRWNGAASPVADSPDTLRRLASYRRSNLTASALFAVELASLPRVSQLGRSAAKPAAE